MNARPALLAAMILPISGAAAAPVALPQIRILPECRKGAEADEIVVCGEAASRSPYRLPAQPDRFNPAGPIDSVSRERNRLLDEGSSGTGSCSTVGPGGFTGCDVTRWKRAREQHGR